MLSDTFSWILGKAQKKQVQIVDPTRSNRWRVEPCTKCDSLITFSGIDGCGKSTQAHLLKDKLLAEGFPVLVDNYKITSNPRFMNARNQLYHELEVRGESLSSDVMGLLIAFDYYSHIVNDVQSKLDDNKHVICDRYVYDLCISQKYIFGTGFEDGWRILSKAPHPGLAILIDVPAEMAMSRILLRGLVVREHEELAVLQVKREAYLEMSQRSHQIVLDGRQPPDALHREIWDLLAYSDSRLDPLQKPLP